MENGQIFDCLLLILEIQYWNLMRNCLWIWTFVIESCDILVNITTCTSETILGVIARKKSAENLGL